MRTIKEQTLSSAKWTAIEKFGLQGMQFILGIIMARLLTPDDYGTVGMIAIFFSISSSFIDSGFSNALVRKQDCTEEDYNTVFYFNIVVALVCYTILFVAAPWIADFFHTPLLCAIVRIQSVNLLLNSLMLIQVAKLRKNLDFKALAKRSMIATLVSGFIGVIMAYCGLGVWALVYQGLISTFINLIYIWIYCRWYPKWLFSWVSFKELGSYGSKLFVAGLLHTLYTNITTFVIGRFYSAKDLGYYNRGTNLATLPVDTVNDILLSITFPILARIQNDDERLISIYRKYIRVMSIPIFFGCMLLVSMGKPLIVLLFTEKWLPAVDFLTIFAFAIMFNHITTLNLNLLKVKGRSDLFLKLEIIKKAISFVILFTAIPFGPIAICVSKVIYTQIATYINTYYTGKLFGLGYWTQVKDFSFYLFAAVLSCFPMYIVNTYTDLNYLVGVFLALILGITIYWFILRQDENFAELILLASQKLPFLKRFIRISN